MLTILRFVSIALLVGWSAPALAGEDSALPAQAAVPGEDQPVFHQSSSAAQDAKYTSPDTPAQKTVYGRLVPKGESALQPTIEYDKSSPPPKVTHWPKPVRKMYAHAAPHPAVVKVYTTVPPKGPEAGGKEVYVNTPGSTYHLKKTRMVHSQYLKIPKKQAEKYGYKPNKYSNPDDRPRTLNPVAPK